MRTTININGSEKGITRMTALTVEEVQLITRLRQLRAKGWDRFLIERKEEFIMVCTVGRPEPARGE